MGFGAPKRNLFALILEVFWGPPSKVKIELPCRRELHFHPPGRPPNRPKNWSGFEGAPGPLFFSIQEARTKKSAEKVSKWPPGGGKSSFLEVFFSPGRLLGPKVTPGSSQVTPRTHFSRFWDDFGTFLVKTCFKKHMLSELWQSLSDNTSNKKWRAFRPVFLTFGEPFLQAEYQIPDILILNTKKSNKKMAGAPPCISNFLGTIFAGRVPDTGSFDFKQ